MRRQEAVALVLCLALISLVGCGSGADENKPISEVRAEAQGMDASGLQKKVDAYMAAIEAKKPELEKLQAKVSEISLTEILGDEAKALKADVERVQDSIDALKQRMEIYADELKKKAQE